MTDKYQLLIEEIMNANNYNYIKDSIFNYHFCILHLSKDYYNKIHNNNEYVDITSFPNGTIFTLPELWRNKNKTIFLKPINIEDIKYLHNFRSHPYILSIEIATDEQLLFIKNDLINLLKS